MITDILKVVTNDTKITTNVDFAEFEDDVEIVQQVAVEEEEIVEEQPFLVAETMPSFQGGSLNDFRNWVQSKVRYPAIAQENGISGKVVLTFVIEKDGRLTNIQVLQTPDRSLSDEAIRVLQQSEVHPACGIPHPAVNLHRPPETVPRTVRPSEVRINNKGISFRGIPFFSMRLEL